MNGSDVVASGVFLHIGIRAGKTAECQRMAGLHVLGDRVTTHTRGDALGFFRSLIGATIGFAIAGPVGLVAGPLIAHDTSGGSCDGSDVGDSGSGLGDTMD